MKSSDIKTSEKVYGRSKIPISEMYSTKEDARAAGHIHYFTGKPCKNGHMAPRYLGGDCFDCIKQKNKEYLSSKGGRERIKALQHSFWETNKDEIQKKQQEYRKQNKEAISNAEKSYYKRNREKILARKKLQRQENHSEFLKRGREYRRKNRDRINQLQRERYRKKKLEVE